MAPPVEHRLQNLHATKSQFEHIALELMQDNKIDGREGGNKREED